MSPDETNPFRLFGLPRDATAEEIRQRYRQLALAYHPDRSGGNDKRRARQFDLVHKAYDAILQARLADKNDRAYGPCAACGSRKILIPRLDGTMVCRDCVGRSRWMSFLPAPPIIVVKCTFSITCLLASVVCLVMLLATEQLAYGLVSVTTGLAGLVVVATLGFFLPVHTSYDLRRTQDKQASRIKRRSRPR